MLPNEQAATARTIFINPNFQRPPIPHINPDFLRGPMKSSIYVNPNFLAQKSGQPTSLPSTCVSHHYDVDASKSPVVLPIKNSTPQPSSTIISKSRTKIIRVPMKKKEEIQQNPISQSENALIKIGLRKLVRKTVSVHPPIQLRTPAQTVGRGTKYKVDRRILPRTTPMKVGKGRYPLRKYSASMSISRVPFAPSSKNKKLQMLNINGLLYKSTQNKLERKYSKSTSNSITSKPHEISVSKKMNSGRIIFVRGIKYSLDNCGFKLTQMTSSNPAQQKSLRRIDIGGLTYIAKSKNVLVRTATHLTRNHVSTAKQKSINLLSKNRVKTNIPCPIYRRLGKCAAFERGKCAKVHDKKHVAICPKFLRGECTNMACLLSHNVSLSKMPVCKFFLQGCCVREDCQYLHKKLSATAEICADFIKGFCTLAEKCNKRHEFACPELETRGKCDKDKCIYCKKSNQIQANKTLPIGNSKMPKIIPKSECLPETRDDIQKETDEANRNKRYFTGLNNNIHDIDTAAKSSSHPIADSRDEEHPCVAVPLKRGRPRLGELPAFIPFS